MAKKVARQAASARSDSAALADADVDGDELDETLEDQLLNLEEELENIRLLTTRPWSGIHTVHPRRNARGMS